MNLIPDLAFAAVIIIAFIIGYRKGLLRSVWKIAAFIITIVLVMAFKKPALEFISGTPLAANINAHISGSITIPQGGGVNIGESLHLPEFMQTQINTGIGSASSSMSNIAASSLTGIVLTIIVCIGLFIIIRLILMAAFMIINTISKAPLINGANRLAGGLLAAVNALLLVLLALALFTMFAPADSDLYEMINHSYIVNHLYNNNILLKLFMR